MNKYIIQKEFDKNVMWLNDILGTRSTSNIQLDRLGFYLFGSRYLGAFPADHMLKYIRDRNVFIVIADPIDLATN